MDAGKLPAEDADEYCFKYGYACFEQERFEAAVRLMARIAFTSDYYPHAQYVMGYSEYRKGEYQSAKRYFTVIADHPAYSNVLPFYILQIEFNDGNYHYVRENGGAVLRKPMVSSFIQTVTVGFGIAPNHAYHARGLYRQSGISPCPEDIILFS